MVQKVTQTIQVYGARFKVESEELLSTEQNQMLADTFREFSPKIVGTLAKGRQGEPPLSIVVAPTKDWHLFAKTLLVQLTLKFQVSRSLFQGPIYIPEENILFLLPDPNLKKDSIRHEFFHAVDDFGCTRFFNDFSSMEIYLASSLIFQSQLNNISYTMTGSAVGDAEFFADLFDKREHMKKELPNHGILGSWKSSVDYFLQNYPRIPGVDPRDQFQTNDLPPLFELGKK